jgi:hypothetical protein
MHQQILFLIRIYFISNRALMAVWATPIRTLFLALRDLQSVYIVFLWKWLNQSKPMVTRHASFHFHLRGAIRDGCLLLFLGSCCSLYILEKCLMGGASRRVCQDLQQKDASRSDMSAKREMNHAHKSQKSLMYRVFVRFTKVCNLFCIIWFVMRRFRAFAAHSCTAD